MSPQTIVALVATAILGLVIGYQSCAISVMMAN